MTPLVGYVVSTFPCWSETFILREILALAERGVPVRIFSLTPPRESLVQAEARPLLADVIYPRPGRVVLSLLRRPWTWLAAACDAWREAAPRGLRERAKALYTVAVAAAFGDAARRLGVRHLHAHWATYPGLAVRTMRRFTGLSCSLTAHAHDIFLPNPHLRANVDAAHTVVTISDYNLRHLSSLGLDAARLTVVPCGLDLRQLRPPDDDARVSGAILAVGRLAPLKGFVHLIDACALLRDRGVKLTCDIIGDGPLRAELERQIVAKDLADVVRLRGALDQSDVRASLSRAELFVLPSVRARDGDQDGIPVALMEAMAMEVPVVTSRLSGIPELVVDGVSGLLVEPGDVPGLAEAMQRLLTDPLLRAELGARGREMTSARHDITRCAARMDEIFREAIQGGDRCVSA